MSHQWEERKRPLRLERRYEFNSYTELRDFLDAAADLSEAEDFYPDMGFGTNYVNVTIHADDDAEAMSDAQHKFAESMDALGGYTEAS